VKIQPSAPTGQPGSDAAEATASADHEKSGEEHRWPLHKPEVAAIVTSGWPTLLQVIITISGLLALANASEDDIGRFGLISALPPFYWASLATTAAIFGYLTHQREQCRIALITSCSSLALLLHGAPALVEHKPRFSTAWNHAGMVEQIVHHGSLLPGLDASRARLFRLRRQPWTKAKLETSAN
jgi:hypothetical protein